MSYRLAKQRIVLWPIDVMAAVDGGAREAHPITLRLKLIDAATLEDKADEGALGKVLNRLGQIASGGKEKEAREFLKEHVLDWQDVLDEDDKPVPFSLDNLVAAMNDLAFSRAVSKALSEASYGGAARKN